MPTDNRIDTTGTTYTYGWTAPAFVDVPDLQAFLEDDDITQEEIEDILPVKEIIKKRHLNGHERAQAHKPASDWIETPAGEVCRSADTLMVHDILKKHGLIA